MRSVEENISDLENALGKADGYFPEISFEVKRIASQARSRMKVGSQHTVVVFAGATGGGKSSLFNALLGREVSPVSPTRPTTSRAFSVSAGGAGALLDWMNVPSRLNLPDELHEEHLVLVDLPDIDSFEYSHRQTALKAVERADAVVFVLDPQKYADAVVHHEYLTRFSHREATSFIVLNQVDKLSEADRADVLEDLGRLMAKEKVNAPVFETSAVTGEGINELRQAIEEIARKQEAAQMRVQADILAAARMVDVANAHDEGREPRDISVDSAPVVEEVCVAAGVERIGESAAYSYEKSVKLKPLGLFSPRKAKAEELSLDNLVDISALGKVRREVENFVREELQELPLQWRIAEQSSLVQGIDSLVEDTAEGLASVNIATRTPLWCRLIRCFSYALGLAIFVSVMWLILLAFGIYVGVDLPRPRYFGPVSLPTLIVLLSFGAWMLLTFCARGWKRIGAERARIKAQRECKALCTQQVELRVVAPVRQAKSRYSDFYLLIRKVLDQKS